MSTDEHEKSEVAIAVEAAVAAINEARSALEAIAKPYTGARDEVLVQTLAGVAADSLFDVLNSANAYCVAPLHEDDIHNRKKVGA